MLYYNFPPVLKESDAELAATNASQSSQQVHMIADEVGDLTRYEEDFVKNFFLPTSSKGRNRHVNKVSDNRNN